MGTPIEDIIREADTFIGTRYLFGGEETNCAPNDIDCCLAGGSMVATDRGPVPIEAIMAGDVVYAYDAGRLVQRKVVQTWDRGEQECFAVRTGNRTVVASANHPFLRATFPTGKGGGHGPDWPKTDWARLDSLAKKNWLVIATSVPLRECDVTALPDGTPITDDIAWLMGLFLADGSVSHNRGVALSVSWCKYGDKRERVGRIVLDTWGYEGTHSDSGGITFSRREFAAMWDEVFGRVTSRTKRVPQVILDSSPSVWATFLDGHAAGDGHVDKRGYLAVHAANETLVRQLHGMRTMLGNRVSSVRTQPRGTKPIVIKGVEVKDAANLWTFETYPGREQGNVARMRTVGWRGVTDAHLGYEKVRSVRPVGMRRTYDIEVEGAHNFVADGVVVHNSELIESACRCTGVSPTMPDGSGNQFDHCDRNGLRISFEEARQTRGALIFKSYGTSYPPGDRNEGGIYHVAISLGDGTTAEVCCDDGDLVGHKVIDGRSWYGWGGRIPGADYGSAPTPIPPQPEPPSNDVPVTLQVEGGGTVSLRELRKGANGRDVRQVQALLTEWQISPGTHDGDFGSKTDTAVRQFQSARGLTSDGIVGERTYSSLLGR